MICGEREKMQSNKQKSFGKQDLNVWKHVGYNYPIPVGLENSHRDNQCYLNSVLQVVTFQPKLYTHIRNSHHMSYCLTKDFCLLCEMIKHLTTIANSQKKVYNPLPFTNNIEKICRQFKAGMQQDVLECLEAFINKLGNSEPLITCMVQGKLKHAMQCLRCNSVTHNSEVFRTLQLNLKDKETQLQWSLKQFRQPDIVPECKCDCSDENVEIKKSCTVEVFPDILVIQINRFNSKLKKNTNIFKYPLQFSGALLTDVSQHNNKIHYNLNSVIVHEGSSLHCGHYYVYTQTASGDWFILDDDLVEKVDVSCVLKQSAVYVCIYQKCFWEDTPTSNSNKRKADCSNELDICNNDSSLVPSTSYSSKKRKKINT